MRIVVFACASLFSFLLLSLITPTSAIAQEKKSNGHLVADEGNFTSFSSPVTTATIEQWKLHNNNTDIQHPEFGYRAVGAPKQNVIEVLSKRTANERFFINPERPSEFYQQTSYGPMHYEVNGQWISINPNLLPLQNGVYEASSQPEPVGFDIHQKHSYIKTVNGIASFNNWTLYGVKDGVEQLLAQADWTNYTAGDNGLYITNVFPGIDLKMRVLQGAVKADFVVKSIEFHNLDYFLFKDLFNSSDALASLSQAGNSPTEFITANGSSLLTIGDAVIYPEGAAKEEMILTDYKLEQNKLGIAVSYNWLLEKIPSGNVIIDPLVTATNNLAQASITGSQFNASCNFDSSCNFNLNVTPPANATITNILANFNYVAAGQCWLEDGGTRFGLGNCMSPNQSGYFWFCNAIGGGTCNGNNIPVWDDFATCAPPPSCNPSALAFTLRFYRGCYGNAGCSSGCISAGSAWSMVIQGYTLQHTSANPTQQMTLSATSVCQGGSVTATSVGIQYGVPPYTVNWSLSNTGTPSIGTGNNVTTTLNNIGTNTIYSFITDACGNTINSSRTVTVTNPPAGPAVTSPVNLCLNATASPLTSPGNTPRWYDVATGGVPILAPTPATGATGTTSYWVSQMVGGCESQRSQVDVIVHPLPVISGTPVITPSDCAGATGAISGLTTNAPTPVTYTWLNSSSAVVSSSTTSSDLTAQPAGAYTLVVTDGFGCESSPSVHSIPNQNSPAPPTTTTPVVYCQSATAVALVATGSNVLWYDQPGLISGSSVAPIPSTSVAGSTTYYVTQTVNGCESLPVMVTVQVTATPSAPSVTSPVTYCQNANAAALQATGSGLLWYSTFAGGAGSSSTPSVNTSTGDTQNYYVSQTVSNCESPRAQIIVEIIPLPTFTGTPAITASNCDQSTGSISGINVVVGSSTMNTFSWQNSTESQVGNTLTLSNQPAGSYTLVVTDQDQCSASYGPVSIPVANPPAAPQAISPVGYCQGYTAVPLTANGSSILWYTTATGGTGSSTAPTPITTLVGATSYFATQTVNGCESARREIIVNVVDSPGAEFSVLTQVGCAPFCPSFENLSTPTGAPIIDYQWSANGESFSNEQLPNHCFQPGMYDIELFVTDAIGCTKTVTKENYITVVPGPVSNFHTSRFEAPEEDALIVFTSINPRPNETIVWSFGDGSSDTALVASHFFPEAGRYCISQTVTSNYGCSDRSEQCVLITSDFYLYIPNAFTPTGDGINDVWKPEIKGKFTSYRLSIFNRWGERVFFTTDINTPWVGDIEEGEYFYAPDGMYHFVIILEDEERMPKEYRGHIQLLR